jgi:hypothetical protein
VEIFLAVVLGLVAAGAVAGVLDAIGLPERRTAVGALFVGALVGLGAGDLLIDGAGAWWEGHPMLAAGLGGLLLLGLTVLVIDEVIARTTAARWQKAARDPVARLVATKRAFALMQLGAAVRRPDAEQRVGTPAVVRRAVGLLDRTVVAGRALTPVLTASDDLLEVYSCVTAVADDAERLAQYAREYLEAHGVMVERELRGTPIGPDTALPLFAAWFATRRQFPHLEASLEELGEVATRVLGAGVTSARSPDAPTVHRPRV